MSGYVMLGQVSSG